MDGGLKPFTAVAVLEHIKERLIAVVAFLLKEVTLGSIIPVYPAGTGEVPAAFVALLHFGVVAVGSRGWLFHT